MLLDFAGASQEIPTSPWCRWRRARPTTTATKTGRSVAPPSSSVKSLPTPTLWPVVRMHRAAASFLSCPAWIDSLLCCPRSQPDRWAAVSFRACCWPSKSAARNTRRSISLRRVSHLLGIPSPSLSRPPSGEPTGDPHMVGFHGQKFDFTGQDGVWYALISSLPSTHINMRGTGRRFAVGLGAFHLTYLSVAARSLRGKFGTSCRRGAN